MRRTQNGARLKTGLIAREMSAEDWRITDIGRYLEEI